MVKRLSTTDQNENPLVNVPTPVNDGDATNMGFVEDRLATKVDGTVRITSSAVEPSSPEVGDLWFDPDDDVGQGANSIISKEIPDGTINGVNQTFSTALPYIGNSLEVYVNGLAQGNLITETNPNTGVFVLSFAPVVGDNIVVSYQYANGTTTNADTVDGFHASPTGAPNTIPVLDENGQLPEGLGGGGGGADMDTIFNLFYPVGVIYTNAANGTNPGTLFGYGTWEPFGAGKTLVSLDPNDSSFSSACDTGGAKDVTLTEAQMPSHTHAQNSHSHSADPPSATTNNTGNHTHQLYQGYGAAAGSGKLMGVSGDPRADSTTSNGAHSHTVNIGSFTTGGTTATNQNTGGGEAHENMPPYVVVYMWVRTA